MHTDCMQSCFFVIQSFINPPCRQLTEQSACVCVWEICAESDLLKQPTSEGSLRTHTLTIIIILISLNHLLLLKDHRNSNTSSFYPDLVFYNLSLKPFIQLEV